MQGIQAKELEIDSELSGEPAAASEVLLTLELLIGHFALLSQDSRDDGVRLEQKLEEAQELLEGCVECVLNQWLGNLKTAVTRPLDQQWSFPSENLPIGAKVGSICVCSWNMQGLKGQEGQQQSLVNMVLQMLFSSSRHKHVVCLQGCWRELLVLIAAAIRSSEQDSFDMDWVRSCQQARASQPFVVTCDLGSSLLQGSATQSLRCPCEAIIYDKRALEMKSFEVKQLLFPDRRKALRVVRRGCCQQDCASIRIQLLVSAGKRKYGYKLTSSVEHA